jgi:hypothetical protein
MEEKKRFSARIFGNLKRFVQSGKARRQKKEG